HDTRSCGACTGTPSVAEVKRRIDLLVDGWKANFMRLDLESYGTSGVLTDATYLSYIQQIVQYIGTKPNVYVMLSVWVDPSLTNTGWPSANTNKILQKLVDTFHHTPYVLFGISNEPQGNYDGSLDSQVWTLMNNAVTAVRSQEAMYGGPQHVVAAQGTGGWSRFLQYYMTHPITAGGGTNVAYEVHVYDPASTFTDRFINPSKVIPVIIGEYGPVSGTMTTADCTTLQTQAKAAEVPYLAWTFHMRCPPNLLVDNSNGGCGVGMSLAPSPWGQVVQKDLATAW
ncbi:MAG TPA: cellulase family glycosylhydrolase, partial [Myxococcota bacterium]|nr:cellulase family glycosylhydrolase [Myxococcota bacterium]